MSWETFWQVFILVAWIGLWTVIIKTARPSERKSK